MLSLIIAVLSLMVATSCVLLRKTYNLVPVTELKRQAAGGNQIAQELYRAVGYGTSLTILLWKSQVLALAVFSVALAGTVANWLAVLCIGLVLYLLFAWLPVTRVSGPALRLARLLTPGVAWLLYYLDPLYGWWARWVEKHRRPRHSGLYEVEDLLDMLDLQLQQPDSRITAEEIGLIRQVLSFNERVVRDVLRPKSAVKSVALGDTVGPVLLDELHASGQSVFPVKKTARSKEIVASLFINDVGIHSKGSVEQYAATGVTVVQDDANIADVLHQFHQTKQQLFIVNDNHDEYVGIVTLEDILLTLAGRETTAEPVATEPDAAAPTDETPQTVVE